MWCGIGKYYQISIIFVVCFEIIWNYNFYTIELKKYDDKCLVYFASLFKKFLNEF